MLHGWLIGNGFMKSAAFERLYAVLESAAKACGVLLTRRYNDEFCPFSGALFDAAPDFVLFWDKDVRLARQMEKQGLRLFNSAESIALCDDKTLTYLALQGAVPMPETILAPLTFTDYGAGDFLDRVAECLSYPYVMKEGLGSFGQQVYLIHEKSEALTLLNRIGEKPVLFQKFIRESAGCDVRVYVVGGRCTAAMERRSPTGDFRANIGGGGTAFQHALSAEEERIALLSAKRLGLTFGGVDLLMSENGPLLCEVNSNAHFAALSALTGVNPAINILEEVKRQCAAH